VFRDGGAENLIHKGLESGGGIAKSKIHYCWFEQPLPHLECGFVFVAGLDSYVVITLADVELCEEGCATEVMDEVSNEW
jgi:hypothetical protein